jgi:acyl carrier protein
MELNTKFELIAEILDISVEEISLENLLEDYESWDSMASLMLISTLEESFSRTDIEGTQISNMKTIEDIIKVMENLNE